MAAAPSSSAAAAISANGAPAPSAPPSPPPAPTPSANGTTANAAPAAAAPWFATIEDSELRGYTENKAWKSPVEAVKSYRELESTFSKVRGAPPDRLLVLPGPDAKPEDWAAVHERLGRPKTAADYQLAGPDGTLTEPFAQHIGPVMHTLGITAAQAKGLNEAYNQFAAQLTAQQETDFQAKATADLAALHQEWPGQVYNERMELASRAAKSYGLEAETLDKMEEVLGTAGVYRLFAKIGAGQGEGGRGFELGNTTNTTFGLTPEGARAQLAALKQDKEFGKKFINGDVEARARVDRLEQIIAASNSANVVR